MNGRVVRVGVEEAKVKGTVKAATAKAVNTVFRPSMLKAGISFDQMEFLYRKLR